MINILSKRERGYASRPALLVTFGVLVLSFSYYLNEAAPDPTVLTRNGDYRQASVYGLTGSSVTGKKKNVPGGNTENSALFAAVDSVPDEHRFTQIVLDEKMNEPMELAVTSDGDVFYIERKGSIKMYHAATGKVQAVGKLAVYAEYEDGLLGLALDPAFDRNHFMFLYYSPSGPKSINRLSRFTIVNNKIDLKSEKILLEVPVVRACCHSGGSVTFGPDGNLYLSLGDDTNPFESGGYNPIDQRPGKWDAQKTSGNSNDLRGKILRIHPEPDGSYTIPDGNLFPKGTPNARPEIYVMGNRNPFRISVDTRTNFLYWGEVGPDAGEDSSTRGPRGHDEINQARKAGFFGWPYFVGDNKAYTFYDFAKEKSGAKFIEEAPVNNSPNNTGVKNLPPAQRAFIWYPYTESKEFPQVGKGGRNAMAGPVYYNDDYKNSNVRFPAHYNGKLFIYDWMRNWIMAVTMDGQGNYVQMEPFMPGTGFNKPVDMQFGKDGALYVLEYGTYWTAQNEDSRLSRIEFNEGNRKPVVKLTADKQTGSAPFNVRFSAGGSFDYDREDVLRFEWSFTQPGAVQSTERDPRFTFTKPGIYKVTVKAIDSHGETATGSLTVEVGNEPPVVTIQTPDNKSFYWDNSLFRYQVVVSDKEDGRLGKGIDPSKVTLRYHFKSAGEDMVAITQGHQTSKPTVGNAAKGRILIGESDCKACHAMAKTSVGPAYLAVAKRYRNTPTVAGRLAAKIIRGGGGAWGDREMSAHPQLSKAEAQDMVAYILSLGKAEGSPGRLPLKGQLIAREHVGKGKSGSYDLIASYTDRGGNGIKAITRQERITLKYPMLRAADADEFVETAKANVGETQIVKYTTNGSYLVFKNIDLTGVKNLLISLQPKKKSGRIEIRLGSHDGRLIGITEETSGQALLAMDAGQWVDGKVKLEPVQGVQDVYFVYKGSDQTSIWNTFDINTIYFSR